jgi:hypothetical protein
MTFLTLDQLESSLPLIREAPRDRGVLRMIVRRPDTEQREVLEQGKLDLAHGLVGDNWRTRGSKKTPDGSAHPDMQITIMGARTIELLAATRDRWALAGDQLFIDLDLSQENLPPGTRLAVGEAVVQISELPHTGCRKFEARFGPDALKFVNSPMGRQLRLRGLNAKIIQSGVIRTGDAVQKT